MYIITDYTVQQKYRDWHKMQPWIGAIVVEDVELCRWDQLTAIDSGLDSSETTKYSHLFHVAHDRRDVKTLQLRVDCMQTADQVLQEQLERLRQTDQLTTVNVERGNARTTVVDQSTGVVLRVTGDRWRRVADRRNAATAVRTAERWYLLGDSGLMVLV